MLFGAEVTYLAGDGSLASATSAGDGRARARAGTDTPRPRLLTGTGLCQSRVVSGREIAVSD